jgi:hypothetical protein
LDLDNKIKSQPGVVTQSYNLSIQDAEAEGGKFESLRLLSLFETLSLKKKKSQANKKPNQLTEQVKPTHSSLLLLLIC